MGGLYSLARVLLIDDDDLVLQTMRLALAGSEHEVHTAVDGLQALDIARTLRPHLVVTDIIMPRREGLETIRELRRDHPDVRIVAISGGGSSHAADYLEVARKFGADQVLRKPFKPAELRRIIDDLLAGDS